MNVIWIISDTLRQDHLGCYGNKEIHTPSLDTLAAKSIRFDRHYIASYPTMPARADYLTGRHTACFMDWEPLPTELVSLAPLLKNKGVHTAAVVDTPFYLRGDMNYDRGFRTFIEVAGQDYWLRGLGDDIRRSWCFDHDRLAARTFTKATEWLEQHYKEDFLLYIDTWDPHEPWDAPNYYTELYWPDYDGELISPVYANWQDIPGMTEEKVRKAHATYCGEITMVDTWAGYFLRQVENMGLTKNTAIIFTSDHGFYFGEHGGRFGKTTFARLTREDLQLILGNRVSAIAPATWVRSVLFESGGPETTGSSPAWARSPLFEEVTVAPLLIYMPGVSPGVSKGLTSAIDLMPTVLDIMGQEMPAEVEGHSLLPMMQDTNLKGREYVVSAHPFSNPNAIVRSVDGQARMVTQYSDATVTTNEWSLLYDVEAGQSLLYHLPSDPKQEKNAINERPEVAHELHQLLVTFMRENNLAPHLLEPRLELSLRSTQ